MKKKDLLLSLFYTILSIPAVFIIVIAVNPTGMIAVFTNRELTAVCGMFVAIGFFIGKFAREVTYYLEEALKEARELGQVQRSS
ncbi:hypothetical protein HNQ34_002018 [Anoxybacillus tepidamans]|uniref:Uncharacterized protein n=1 Tax=Anoxybacteroides tepidamans TaxID=265948 RepID=A0A7W8IQK6_9BACL|nr:hypothetical protein [Anoxybacillus tepidamans]MBB5324920.1 hypothetical protein [Anoxybacillus tepidamans]